MDNSELMNRLIRLDEDAQLTFSNDFEFKCYIVGGGAFILLGYLSRATHDIDVIQVVPDKLTDLFSKYDFNTNVSAYYDNFPSDFESRAIPIDIDTKLIKYYSLSLEDLVISKLCTTRGEQDIMDITDKKVLDDIDWNLLENLSKQIEYTMFSSFRYQLFLDNYNNYVERYRK